jgi:hypothetical protein
MADVDATIVAAAPESTTKTEAAPAAAAEAEAEPAEQVAPQASAEEKPKTPATAGRVKRERKQVEVFKPEHKEKQDLVIKQVGVRTTHQP